MEIRTLDHGHVRLVDHMGDDLSIVRAARVSHDAVWRTGEDAGRDAGLIRYMLTHGHSTPFEHVTFTFDVKAPIFVFRQWHRHRTQSYNELSARYTELADEWYVPEASTIGTQDTKNRQGRVPAAELDGSRAQELVAYDDACQRAFNLYHRHLAAGWPRELARLVLPVSTYSQMFATMNLHNLLHFLELRLDAHAQHEIREYARGLWLCVVPHVTVTLGIWRELHPQLFQEEWS